MAAESDVSMWASRTERLALTRPLDRLRFVAAMEGGVDALHLDVPSPLWAPRSSVFDMAAADDVCMRAVRMSNNDPRLCVSDMEGASGAWRRVATSRPVVRPSIASHMEEESDVKMTSVRARPCQVRVYVCVFLIIIVFDKLNFAARLLVYIYICAYTVHTC
jgi:hypothetical protein